MEPLAKQTKETLSFAANRRKGLNKRFLSKSAKPGRQETCEPFPVGYGTTGRREEKWNCPVESKGYTPRVLFFLSALEGRLQKGRSRESSLHVGNRTSAAAWGRLLNLRRAAGPQCRSTDQHLMHFHLLIFCFLFLFFFHPLQARFNLSAPRFRVFSVASKWGVSVVNEAQSISLGRFCCSSLPVSCPLGPGAAEMGANRPPPTDFSLAAGPVLGTALFMFLSVNNNLKVASPRTLGRPTCEAACRRWIGDVAQRRGRPRETSTSTVITHAQLFPPSQSREEAFPAFCLFSFQAALSRDRKHQSDVKTQTTSQS